MADEVNESKSVDEGKENTEENIEAEKVVVSEADGDINAVEAGEETAKPKSKKPMIIVIACIVVVLIACLAVFLVLNEKNKQAHVPVPVSFAFEASGYDPQTGSGIPIHVEGVDLDNKTVSEMLLVDAGSPGLELLRGSYDITVAGSPVTGSGGIYAVPDTVTHIEIAEGNVTINGESFSFDQNEGSPIELPVVVFTAIKPQDVTDKQIVAVRAWMGDVGFGEETIDKFADLIIANKKAGIAKAEEEKLAAWRTKISGTFSGVGDAAGPPSMRIKCSLDGNKLTVRGALVSKGGSYLSGSEWHFILTDKTRYSYTEEITRSTTRSDFVQCFPSSFVVLDIEVQDGYVISMDTHA